MGKLGMADAVGATGSMGTVGMAIAVGTVSVCCERSKLRTLTDTFTHTYAPT